MIQANRQRIILVHLVIWSIDEIVEAFRITGHVRVREVLKQVRRDWIDFGRRNDVVRKRRASSIPIQHRSGRVVDRD